MWASATLRECRSHTCLWYGQTWVSEMVHVTAELGYFPVSQFPVGARVRRPELRHRLLPEGEEGELRPWLPASVAHFMSGGEMIALDLRSDDDVVSVFSRRNRHDLHPRLLLPGK